MPLAEYLTVQIRTLLRDDEDYDPFGINDRSPRVGDTGTIVQIGGLEEGQPTYTVERGRSDGTCVWLAEFAEEEITESVDPELEAVEDPPQPSGEDPQQPPEIEIEPPSEPPPALEGSQGSDDSAIGATGAGWLMHAGTGIAALLYLALGAAGVAAVFILWPPDSAIGAGLRATVVVVIWMLAGGSLVGEKLVDLLITTTIGAFITLVLSALIWSQWPAN